MHQQVRDFLESAKIKYPKFFVNKRVLELGSFNINGTPRDMFSDCEYVGVDRSPGPCVDVVSVAHEYKSDKKFDVVITTEMLEHDKYADKSIKNALSLLKKGGLLIGTAANIARPPHYESVGEDGHYANITADQVRNWGNVSILEEDDKQEDIRFVIIK